MKKHLLPTGYDLALQALRSSCQAIADIHDIELTRGGVIAFYRYEEPTSKEQKQPGKPRHDGRKMKIFPLEPGVMDTFFPDDLAVQNAIYSHINEKRPYSELSHPKEFREKHKNGRLDEPEYTHYILKLHPDDVIHHSVERDEVLIGTKMFTWEEVATKLTTDQGFRNTYYNTLDHLLLESGTDSVVVIPIPVLSTPTALIFLPLSCFTPKTKPSKIERFIFDLTNAATEALIFFLYHRMMHEVTANINYNDHLTEDDLFAWFIKCMSHILLPINYAIDGGAIRRPFRWFNNAVALQNSVGIHFSHTDSNGRVVYEHSVALTLPAFETPYFDGTGSMYKAIHEWHEYSIREGRIAVILNDIYKMTYKCWEPISKQKEFVRKEIIPVVEQLRESRQHLPDIGAAFNRISNALSKVNELTGQLNDNLERLKGGEFSDHNMFIKELNGTFTFRFDGQDFKYSRCPVGMKLLYNLICNKKLVYTQTDEFKKRFEDEEFLNIIPTAIYRKKPPKGDDGDAENADTGQEEPIDFEADDLSIINRGKASPKSTAATFPRNSLRDAVKMIVRQIPRFKAHLLLTGVLSETPDGSILFQEKDGYVISYDLEKDKVFWKIK